MSIGAPHYSYSVCSMAIDCLFQDNFFLLTLTHYPMSLYRYMNEESARNRDRVLQVHDFSRASKASLHALLSAEDEDGNEEDDVFPSAGAALGK